MLLMRVCALDFSFLNKSEFSAVGDKSNIVKIIVRNAFCIVEVSACTRRDC